MKRQTAYVLGTTGVVICVATEAVIWGFMQGIMALGVCTLLILPAVFVSPRQNRQDRIWIIAIIQALFSREWRKPRRDSQPGPAQSGPNDAGGASSRRPPPPPPLLSLPPVPKLRQLANPVTTDAHDATRDSDETLERVGVKK